MSQALKLKNVSIHHIRAENYTKKADFIISRAVTKMETFVPWIKNKILPTSNNIIKNGILSLKGGDLTE